MRVRKSQHPNFVMPAEFYNFTNVLSITVFLGYITVQLTTADFAGVGL